MRIHATTPTAITINDQPADGKRVAAVYRCKLALDDLKNTDHPDVKFCDRCQQKVFRVIDFDGFEKAVASKGCVWGPLDLRNPADADRRHCFLGAPVPVDYHASPALQWDE